ncbi:conserved hypothetical protein [Cyanobium sp. PCC 7001]|uniref:hypothetical protein n=1 Tax=Cyanobium sp. PCC 7001 TaxID=180281 RepID=UPI0001804A30|nr:hypothetical protein [Cyanobium sp. PCC 7001]EDY39800.1 conserved hypothetical protein [Cyanobium sp. PCC 7001]
MTPLRAAHPWRVALAAVAATTWAAALGHATAAPIGLRPDPESVERRCRAARAAGDTGQLQLLQDELLAQRPAGPSSTEAVLATAEALLVCEAPDAALAVLARHSPAPGPDRQAWLLLQWRAADAGQDHERAARALRWMAAGDLARLESIALPRQSGQSGVAFTRPALDQLADHLESLGRNDEAAEVLLAGRTPGEPQARRWARAVALAEGLDASTREALLEQALDQAAASGAWGLVAALLDQQLAAVAAGPGSSLSPAAAQALRRRLRLSGRIDDAYGEWLLQRRFGVDPERAAELERQLRSPRDPGGHATTPDPSTQP